MTLPVSRLFQSATLLLTLSGASCAFSQISSEPPASTTQLSLVSVLPEAPSYSSSQEPQQQPAAQKNPEAPDVQCTKTPPAPNETDAQRKAREQKDEAECEVRTEEKQRFGGVVPQFNVVMNGQGVPLTPKQKLNISLHTIIDPYTIGLAFIVGGGLGELEDSHTGYGHGSAGFFKRVAASYADNVNGNIIGNALLPIVLKQDPRYFRKGTGSAGSRIFYSAMSTFICRGDNGKREFNTSNVLGNFISGAISNAYYPASERGVGLTLTNGLVVTAEGMVGAQLLEFAPDLTNYIHKRREHHRLMLQQQKQQAPGTPGATPAAPAPAPSTTPPPATPQPSF